MLIDKLSLLALAALTLLSTSAYAKNKEVDEHNESLKAITIQNCGEFQGIGTTTGPLNGVYYQTAHIYCSEINNFIPIGNVNEPFQRHPLKKRWLFI